MAEFKDVFNPVIEGGIVKGGLVFGEHFNVQFAENDNPSFHCKVDFTGMSIKQLAKLAFSQIKVDARAKVLKKKGHAWCDKNIANQVVPFRMMLNIGVADEMSVESEDEIKAKIEMLKAKLAKSAE